MFFFSFFLYTSLFSDTSSCVLCLVGQSCTTLCDPVNCMEPTRLLCPWDSPGKSTAVGCHAFLQGIVPTQGLNPGLPHCRQIVNCLSHQGSHWYQLGVPKYNSILILYEELASDTTRLPGLGRFPGEGNGYPLRYSCLENSVDRGALRATVDGVTKGHSWVNNTFTLSQWHCLTFPNSFCALFHLLSIVNNSPTNLL